MAWRATLGSICIDTADIYSNGLSEEIFGKALGSDRDEVLIATKVRMPMGEGPNDAGLSRHHIIRGARPACGASAPITSIFTRCTSGMGRLRWRRRCEALDDLVQSGKVRYVGCSNYAGVAADEGARHRRPDGLPRFVSQQIYYSLQARDTENELVPVAIDQGLGILVWSPLAGGLLSGKYRRGLQRRQGSPAAD